MERFKFKNNLTKTKYINHETRLMPTLKGEPKMEYKKTPIGFTLEFNEHEKSNFERLVNDLKNHDEFSNISSESEFLSLIINEGVESLQYKVNNMHQKSESESFLLLPDFLATMLNETLSALLPDKQDPLSQKIESPISIETLLELIPDINSIFNETDQSIVKKEHLNSFDDPSTPSPNEDTEVSEVSSKNID
jgi:hypothetical protein